MCLFWSGFHCGHSGFNLWSRLFGLLVENILRLLRPTFQNQREQNMRGSVLKKKVTIDNLVAIRRTLNVWRTFRVLQNFSRLGHSSELVDAWLSSFFCVVAASSHRLISSWCRQSFLLPLCATTFTSRERRRHPWSDWRPWSVANRLWQIEGRQFFESTGCYSFRIFENV